MKTITVVLGTDSTLSDYVSFEVNEATVARYLDLYRTLQDKEALAIRVNGHDVVWHRGDVNQVSDEGVFVLRSGCVAVMGVSRHDIRMASDITLLSDLEEALEIASSGDVVQLCDDDAWATYLEDQEA